MKNAMIELEGLKAKVFSSNFSMPMEEVKALQEKISEETKTLRANLQVVSINFRR